MAIAPRGFVVKSPRCIEPPKFGLLSVVDPLIIRDDHWFSSGIEWEDDLCGPPATGFIDECPPASYEKPAQRDMVFCASDPFLAFGSFDCSPVGRPADEAFEIARRRLLAWEGYQVENVFWTGQGANGQVNPSFAFGNPDCDILPEDVAPTGAVDPVTAFSLLEERLGNQIPCGGFIHVPYSLVAYLVDHRLLTNDGTDEYFSPTGFRVVVGHGYPGTGPGNIAAAPGEAWIYATGPLVMARSDVIMVPDSVPEGVNRLINNITVRAERFYSIGFSCALLAVRVSLTCACE